MTSQQTEPGASCVSGPFRGNEVNTDPRGKGSEENRALPDQRSAWILSRVRSSRFTGSLAPVLLM